MGNRDGQMPVGQTQGCLSCDARKCIRILQRGAWRFDWNWFYFALLAPLLANKTDAPSTHTLHAVQFDEAAAQFGQLEITNALGVSE